MFLCSMEKNTTHLQRDFIQFRFQQSHRSQSMAELEPEGTGERRGNPDVARGGDGRNGRADAVDNGATQQGIEAADFHLDGNRLADYEVGKAIGAMDFHFRSAHFEESLRECGRF